jgi:tryptophan-rich sensory protein
MAKIKTDVTKRLEPKQPLFSNKTIVLIKIAAACLLLLGGSLFFFSYLAPAAEGKPTLFEEDLQNLNPFPLVFLAGLVWVVIYVINLAGHMDDKDLYNADRYDLLYKIVFIVTVMSMVFRCFVFSNLNVPEAITIICLLSGIITMFTPKIVDYNNEEF